VRSREITTFQRERLWRDTPELKQEYAPGNVRKAVKSLGIGTRTVNVSPGRALLPV
jgi:hypothetical protein